MGVRLLAIDTSTSAITVAVHDGTSVLDRESVLDPRGHCEQLAPAIRALLSRLSLPPSALTQVVAGTGPGPFTGLRVGLVTAVTLGYALDIPVGGLCSLDALAHQVVTAADGTVETGGPIREFVVATDARRHEVYWATYRRGGGHGEYSVARMSGPHVNRPSDLAGLPDARQTTELPVAGRGGLLYPANFGPLLGVLDVDAGALAELAVSVLDGGGVLNPPAPAYLRRPDARPLPGVPTNLEVSSDAAPGVLG